jgi:hypothetical protein
MSVVWMDDPSFYNSAQCLVRYEDAGSVQVLTTGGRFGGPCWNFTTNFGRIRKNVPSAATYTMAFSVKWTSQNSIPFFLVKDSGTVQLTARLNAGQIQVFRGDQSVLLAQSSNSVITGVWYRIEFKFTIDPSAGVIEVRVNGTSTGWIPSTGSLNTRASANSTANMIQIGYDQNSTPAGYNFNDYVITDTNSPNANFLGDKRCFLRMPSSDSSVQWTPTFASYVNGTAYVVGQQLKDSNNNVQRCTTAGTASTASPTWATTGGSTTSVGGGCVFTVVGSGSNPGAHNWMAVSENPADDDSSYNLDATPGDIDLFGFPNLPAGVQNIAAVDNVARIRKDDAGTRSAATQMHSGATNATGSTVPLSSTYIYLDTIQETDPNTSAAWVATNLNSATFGYKEVA